MQLVSNEQSCSLFPVCTFGLWGVLTRAAWPSDFDWNQRNDFGHTALYAASCHGYTRIVAFLLDQGADSNLECGRYGSALHSAAYRGHVDVVKLLLVRGADVNFGGKFLNAIHAACRGNQEEAALAIMEHTGITNQQQYDSSLEVIAAAGFSTALEKLQTYQSSESTRPSKMQQTVAKVIVSGKVSNLKYLTRKHTLADILSPGNVALSALHGHEAMTTYLLDQGLSVSEGGDLGSPLRCASISGSNSVCHLLLNRGADVNGTERFGGALHAAAMRGQLHIVKLLLDVGADVNIKGGYYGSPIQAAAYQGHKEVVSMLIKAGADFRQSGFSKDAFHAAAEGGRYDVIHLMLTAGLVPPMPIRYSRLDRMRSGPPPLNLLRQSSVHRGGSRQNILILESSSKNDSQSDDLVDVFNPTPHARAYIPLPREWYDGVEDRIHNYSLEAAAAHGHLEVVRELLSKQGVWRLYDSKDERALLAACRNGHQDVAEEILRSEAEGDNPYQRHELRGAETLRKALTDAAVHAHISVVRVLLAHAYAAGHRHSFESTLLSSIRANDQVFREIAMITEELLPQSEAKDILLKCLSPAARADRLDILKFILSRCEPTDSTTCIQALEDACKDGKVAAVQLLYKTLPSHALSQHKYAKCTRLAVENGYIEVVRYLLPPFQRSDEPTPIQPRALTFSNRKRTKYLRCMIFVASGCGYVEMLKMLLSERKEDDLELLQQALNVAAKNGHGEICAYLASEGADPCTPVPGITWPQLSVDRGRSTIHLQFHSDSASSDSEAGKSAEKYATKVTAMWRKTGKATKSQNAAAKDLLPAGELKALNAIESCISGFKRFGPQYRKDSIVRIHRNSWWHECSEEAQVLTLNLLLEMIPSMANHRWDEAICAAAKLCPPAIVSSMLKKGASAKAKHGPLSAIEYALQRESLCFPVVHALSLHGAIENVTKEELRHWLAQAASFFVEHTGRPERQGALFTETKSLEDVFVTGPGAVVSYLLQRLPQEKFSTPQSTVMLQCACVVGLVDVVTLLLDHQTSVDAISSYYGTALQAASRFGHGDVVKLLLNAGANPNIVQGRHHTALRAAVQSGSLETVSLLLQAGADVELSATWSRNGEHDPTPLQLAIEDQNLEIGKPLIAAGANIHTSGGKRQPPLIQACSSGYVPIICALLDAGVDVHTRGQSSFQREKDISGMHAAIQIECLEVIRFLISKRFRTADNFTGSDAPLVFAAQKGNLAIIDTLLQAEPSVTDDILLQSLKRAVKHASLVAIERLLYCRPSILDKGNGVKILKEACERNDLTIVELLLDQVLHRGEVVSTCTGLLNDPPRRAKNSTFELILECAPCTTNFFVDACARGSVSLVKDGLQQQISANPVDSRGRPALHLAVMSGSVDVVELLLASGADPNAVNTTYGTPLRAALEIHAFPPNGSLDLPNDIQALYYVLKSGYPGTWTGRVEVYVGYSLSYHSPLLNSREVQDFEKIVKLLLERGASPNPPQGLMGSILTLAAFTGVRSIFHMLLERGGSGDSGGYLQSPFKAAMKGKHKALADEIRELGFDASDADDVDWKAERSHYVQNIATM